MNKRCGGSAGLRMLRLLVLVTATAALQPPAATVFAQEAPPLVPGTVTPSKVVRDAANDTLLTDAQRDQQRIFHGLFDEVSAAGKASADYALATWDLNNPLLAVNAKQTAPLLRATAALRRGDMQAVLTLLTGDDSPQARWLRGHAAAAMGHFAEAIQIMTPLRDDLRSGKLTQAADMVAAARATQQLAELEGRPADDYQFVLNQLDAAQQQADRLYWPALVAAANLLIEKDNPQEAVKALHEALRLAPGASTAWYALGELALRGYDFDSATRVIWKLRNIHGNHVLADRLAAEMYLQQRDPDAADAMLLPALMRYPNERHLMADAVAAAALHYDKPLTAALLKQFDTVSPNHPLALYTAGRYLSVARQYDEAIAMLQAAIKREPNWTPPQIELGLVLNQAGDEAEARAVLGAVTKLDPYDVRAANVLKMLDGVATFKTIETDHFIIKYQDGIDAALAGDMPDLLEQIYDADTSAFSYQPKKKTQIEIMPNKHWFAVRITGAPDIWTIAACTGPVIALTPPRIGADQAGPFDWFRVLRHEFTHTVTLEETRNRIPHWFTEAAAVSQEPAPRDYDTCQLLAASLLTDKLFDLDEINWAFVRPRGPNDRALAYAQAHWMFEYITERFGHQTILKMLDLCRQGVVEHRIIPDATGQSPDVFLAGFKQWAHEQVKQWGLDPTPSTKKVYEMIREGKANTQQRVADLLKQYPEQPDLLHLAAESAMQTGDDNAAYALLLRYATVRPVDPWADRKIAELAIKLNRPEEAVSHLEQLDRIDQNTGVHAQELMEIFRKAGRLDEAQHAAQRALIRQPYDAHLREVAAAIALQRKDPELALRHILALTHIEPEQSIHFVRLAAVYTMLHRPADAKSAAEQARKLNPNAPVDAYLK